MNNELGTLGGLSVHKQIKVYNDNDIEGARETGFKNH